AQLELEPGGVLHHQLARSRDLLRSFRLHDFQHLLLFRSPDDPIPRSPDFLHPISIPPFTLSTCPVMYAASSDARKRTACATSISVPARPSGIISFTLFFRSAERPSVMAVSIYPGATAFTVILRDATSRAMAMVKPISPAFEAA